jgi:hypothetical protein
MTRVNRGRALASTTRHVPVLGESHCDGVVRPATEAAAKLRALGWHL